MGPCKLECIVRMLECMRILMYLRSSLTVASLLANIQTPISKPESPNILSCFTPHPSTLNPHPATRTVSVLLCVGVELVSLQRMSDRVV